MRELPGTSSATRPPGGSAGNQRAVPRRVVDARPSAGPRADIQGSLGRNRVCGARRFRSPRVEGGPGRSRGVVAASALGIRRGAAHALHHLAVVQHLIQLARGLGQAGEVEDRGDRVPDRHVVRGVDQAPVTGLGRLELHLPRPHASPCPRGRPRQPLEGLQVLDVAAGLAVDVGPDGVLGGVAGGDRRTHGELVPGPMGPGRLALLHRVTERAQRGRRLPPDRLGVEPRQRQHTPVPVELGVHVDRENTLLVERPGRGEPGVEVAGRGQQRWQRRRLVGREAA